MRKSAFVGAGSLAALLLFTVHAFAAAGALDASFGGDGKVATTGAVDSWANDVLVDPAGRIVAVGVGNRADVFGTTIDAQVTRYLPNGDPDLTFDGDGIAVVAAGDFTVANAAAIQADGKIVIAGGSRSGGIMAFMVARLDTNGVPDPTFDEDGVVRGFVEGPGVMPATGVAITTNGGIIVAGHRQVVKLLPDGSPDPTFSSDGVAPIGPFTAQDVAVQGNSKIVVAGKGPSRFIAFGAVRLLQNGDLDASFAGDGGRVIPKAVGIAEGLALQADGKIVLVGDDHTRSPSDFGVVRLRANGTLDPTFSADGIARIGALHLEEDAQDVLVTPTGRILVTGSGATPVGTFRFLTIRLSSGGGVDRSFGVDGSARTSFGIDAWANAVTSQKNGRIVVAGQASPGNKFSFGLVRYLSA